MRVTTTKVTSTATMPGTATNTTPRFGSTAEARLRANAPPTTQQRTPKIDMPTLNPLNDRVVVRQLEAEEVTKSGIVLPDAAKEKPTRGKIISVGPGKMGDNGKRTPLAVSTGETVVYGKYSGTEIELDHEKFVLLRESDLLGVLE